MTDDYFADYDDAYQRDYSGTTARSYMPNAGRALDSFFGNLRTRARKPLPDYNALAKITGGAPRYSPFMPPVGRASQQAPAFTPAGPPQRYQVNLLGEAVGSLAESAPGAAFLGTKGAVRGGVMDVDTGFGRFGLATVPVNMQNFATYAREAPIAAITSALGHHYQQPPGDDPYAQPAGPVNRQDIFANMSEGDFEGVLDNVIDGVAEVGNAIAAPFVAITDWWRRSDAVNRGKGIRDLALSGATPGTWISRATSLFDDTRFDWEKIAAAANAQGIRQTDLAADLWDLDPQIVDAIFANPNMTDEELDKIVDGQPFSYDPGVNVLVELGVNIAPLVAGGGLVRGTGFVAQGIGGGARLLGGAAEAATGGRLSAAAARTWVNLERLGVIGRPVATADALGARTLVPAWRAIKAAGLGLEKANRYSLIAGSGIRVGEWGLKQTAELLGNDEAVAMMDQWLWEMPLSNNPGLMLVDGFAVHPLRTAKSIYRGTKEQVSVRLFGGEDLAVSPVAARRIGSIAEMPLETVQERLLDRLGWDADAVNRVYGEDGPLSTTDLKNGLLYFAQQVVRDRREASARYLEAEGTIVERNEAFWNQYGEEAVKVLQSALTGRGPDADAIVNAVKEEFWNRANVVDASELGAEGYIGPYDGTVSFAHMASWIRASKLAKQVQEDAAVALRADVNTSFVSEFRARIREEYKSPDAVISAVDLNTLRTQVPASVNMRRGILKRRGERVPKVTRRQLEALLTDLESRQAIADMRDARPETTAVPAIRPDQLENRAAIAKAFKLRQDTIDRLLDTPPEELAGPVPPDLGKVLVDTFHMTESDIRRSPDIAWSRAAEWWQRMYTSAAARGDALDAIDRFAKVVGERFAGMNDTALDLEAFRQLREAVTHPYTRDEKLGPTAVAIAEARDAALTEFVDRMSAWLDDPARGLRLTELADGDIVVIEKPTFRATDVAIINDLAGRAPATLSPEQLAILADPAAHPLEKVPALRAAVVLEPDIGTAVQRRALDDMGDLSVYDEDVKLVIGEEEVATRDTVATLHQRAEAAANELVSLREQVRSLAGIIDRSPTRQLSGELTDFYDRAKALGERKIGKASTATVETWRAVPLDAAGVTRALDTATRDVAVRRAEGRLKSAQERLAQLEDQQRRVSQRGDRAIIGDEVEWGEPVQRFRTRKEAQEAAKVARVDGNIYGVSKVGSRWGLYRGTLRDAPEAQPAVTAQAEPAGPPPATPEPIRSTEGPPRAPFRAATEYGEGVEYVPVDVLRRFIEVDREATPIAEGATHLLDELTEDIRANGVREPATLVYDPITNSASISDGNHRLAAAIRLGLPELPVKAEIIRRTTKEQDAVDAGDLTPPQGFHPADRSPGFDKPFTLLPSHFVGELARLEDTTDWMAPDLAAAVAAGEVAFTPPASAPETAPAAPPAPEVVPEAAPPAAAAPERFQLEAALNEARQEYLRREEAGERLGIANVGKQESLALAEYIAREQDPPPADVMTEGERAFDAIYNFGVSDTGYYGGPVGGADFIDTRLVNDTSRAIRDLAESRAHNALMQSGIRPAWVALGHRLGTNIYKVRWEGDTPYKVGGDPAGMMVGSGKPMDAYEAARLIPMTAKAVDYVKSRMAETKKAGGAVISKADLAAAEKWLDSQEAGQLRSTMFEYEPGTGRRLQTRQEMIEAAETPEAAPVLPIVEQISEADRVREAQVEQLRREAEAQEGALAEATANYEASRVVAGGEPSPVATPDVSAVSSESGLPLRTFDELVAERQALGAKPKAAAARRAWQEDVDTLYREAYERLLADEPQRAGGNEAADRSLAEAIVEGQMVRGVAPEASPLETADGSAFAEWQAADPTDAGALDAIGSRMQALVDEGDTSAVAARDALEEYLNETIARGKQVDEIAKAMRRRKNPMPEEEGTAMLEAIRDKLSGLWAQIGHELEQYERAAEDKPSSVAGATAPEPVVFLDPADNRTPIASRVVLVEADGLLTSDLPGFPPNLQPRSRGVRASSDEQILEYAQDIQPDKLIGVTEGASGMPVVSPDGAVVAGNGRTMALRLAKGPQYGKYKARIQAEAGKYGFDVAQVNAMRRPMLVRELVDVAPADMERLAWQLNEMPIGDLAPSVAAALTRGDIRAFKVGDEQSLGDAIRSGANTEAVARMIGRLPRDWHSRFYDSRTGLNEPGAKLLEAVLLSKLLRADDRARPGFQSARSVVFQIAEQGGEDIRRISGGLAEGAGQLVKAYELAESGALGPDVLTLGDDLAPALARIIELRDSGLTMDGVLNALENTTMFEAMTLTPVQTHLAKLLASSTTQREVRTFLRGIADAAEQGPAAGQELMFADVGQLDYTGMLNEGVRAWNAERVAQGRPEIDYFPSTEAPYDVPLGTGVSESAIGTTEGPARMTQPLAAEEVAPEVVARTTGEALRYTSDDPASDALIDAYRADPEAVARDYDDVRETFLSFGEGRAQQDFYDALLEGANEGTASPGELWLLLELAGAPGQPFIRRNKAGKLNMALANRAPVEAASERSIALTYLQQFMDPQLAQTGWSSVAIERQLLRDLESRAPHTPARLAKIEEMRAHIAERSAELEAAGFPDPNPPVARVIRPQEQAPLTAEELAQDVGPDVNFEPDIPAVSEAMAAADHTLVVGDAPVVNRAVRRAVGAPKVEDSKRRVYEVHAPDAREAAQRIEAARQDAAAELNSAENALEQAREMEVGETTRSSVFPDDQTRELWDRLMRGSDVDELAAAMGSVEPTTLAQVIDAIESIDRGVYADPRTGVGLEAAEAMELRTHLMRLANGQLEAALDRQGVRRTERATAKLGTPPDDFEAQALQDRAKVVMDELGEVVKVDPNLPLLEGFLGAQYVLSKPPTKAKATGGGTVPPRLLFTDRFAGDVIPGLLEELEVGRMEDIPRRIANARVARILDTIVGPRPEKDIRTQAINNFTRELTSRVDPDLFDDVEAKKVERVVETAYAAWRDHIETVKPIGGFQLYRRIHLMGAEALNRMFDDAVREVYGDVTPAWRSQMALDGMTPAKAWRRADNRIRQSILQSGMPLSEGLEKMYGRAADLGEKPGRWLTVAYHFGRFLMDVRWLALEAIEPLMLTLPRGGIGPVLEASAARKAPGVLRAADKVGMTESTKQPLAFGLEQQQLAFREFAHWANVTDIEQGTATRHRYLVRELVREQRRPFREVIKTMMRNDPSLARIVADADGGNVDAFLARLDRDWQLAEQNTREFRTVREAEAFFRPWLEHGVIDERTYREFVSARRYTAHPAIEAELARTVGEPAVQAALERLAAINQDLFHNLTATFFGQENRSNLQRLANHPLLFWPISYQIKATKWVLRAMFDEFAGVDTGATVAGAFQRVHDEHRRRFATDPAYRAKYEENRNLYFMAGMLFPIIPTELGVSMSPWTRMLLYPDYERAGGIFGVGPVYTNLSLVPRLIAEQTKQGGALADQPEIADALQKAFPQTVTIGRDRPATSQIDAENEQLVLPDAVPLPYEDLTTQRTP